MPEDMPERMPERMPEDMPDRMPDRMPEDMSDRMPEDLPVTKCINVMVGITRSKVICFFLWAGLGGRGRVPDRHADWQAGGHGCNVFDERHRPAGRKSAFFLGHDSLLALIVRLHFLLLTY